MIDNTAEIARQYIQFLAGFLRPETSHRARPHSRIYTKRYADGRQKQGGAIHNLIATEVASRGEQRQPKPRPSQAARELRGHHRRRADWL